MHTSHLRGHDFTLTLAGRQTTHAEIFGDFAITRRVGVICPAPLDGLGAAALLLACTTAFYDGYRATGDPFFAYPDFFTFQLRGPLASYGYVDIWPEHKNVAVDAAALTDAITDRAVDILILPANWSGSGDLHPVQQAALKRTLRIAFTYAPAGTVDEADLEIRFPRDPFESWVDKVLATVEAAGDSHWAEPAQDDHLVQTFRQLTLEEVISRL
jgi:hypothetical protein